MADLANLLPAEPGVPEDPSKAFDDGAGIVVDARRDLLGMQRAVFGEQHDVSEGAPDVNTGVESGSAGAAHGAHRGVTRAARSRAVPSSQTTAGTLRQPRCALRAARSSSVARSSTASPAGSMTTP